MGRAAVSASGGLARRPRVLAIVLLSFTLMLTGHVGRPGAANAVAILVTPPAHGCKDLSFCTVDWNPEAPDMNAGLWGKTFLDTTGQVALRDPYVQTTLPLPATNSADLTVYVDAINTTAAPVTTTITGTITKAPFTPITVSQTVTLNANERREISFAPAAYPALHVTNPALWWDTTKAGSAFGTTAEEGTESPPPLESLQKFIPAANLWPIGTVWNYHAGKPKSVFDNIHWFTDGVNNRYGTTTSAADYAKKAEVQNYENTRAFFESWSAHEYTQSFGTIFWMLNGVWPSVHWDLYDWYYEPGGGYFGAKKANEPVHIAYDYVTRNVYVVNSTLTARSGMSATATFYNIPGITAQSTTSASSLSIPANASTQVMTLPAVSGLSTTYFIRLQLKDSTGAVVSNNLYWYSTSPDTFGNKSNWYSTSVRNYANLTGLNSLATNASVTSSASRTVSGGQETVTITLSNTSATNIAFFLRPEVIAGSGGTEVLPVTYTENFVSLFPGESKTIIASYATSDLGGQAPYLLVRGYNVPTTTSAIP